MTMQRLTDVQDKFCQEFIANGDNATQAYMKAGYKYKNYNTATVSAKKLLGTPKIQNRIAELRRELGEKPRIADVEEICETLTSIVRKEPQGDDDKPPGPMTVMRAAELLGRFLGAFVEKKEVDMKGAMPVVIHDDVKE